MSNKALTGISNRVNLPRPWKNLWLPECSPIEHAGRSKYSPMNQACPRTGALTYRVIADRIGWPVKMFCHELGKDAEDWLRLPEPARNKKPKVKILQRQEHKIWGANARLKSWTPNVELTDQRIWIQTQSGFRLVSEIWDVRHESRMQTQILKAAWGNFKTQSSPHSQLRCRACHIRVQRSQKNGLKIL